jgi:cation diffusion facilitator CzcD-associated flavoprotein CzcO
VVPTQTSGTNAEITLFRVSLLADGQISIIYARKIVLASGQDGAGQWWAPDYIKELPAEYWAHTAEPIGFDSLAGKKVAVIGAGASASDSAAMALEHGAASVDMFVRRKKMQRIQPYRWITFAGFLRHLSDLDDEWRWRFMQRVLSMRESIPQATYDRMRRHDNFTIHTDRGWLGVEVAGSEHALQIETTRGLFAADYIIAGTGIDVDFKCKPELATFADRIRTWTDAYVPPPDEADLRLGKYPYLDRHGAYMEKVPGDAPFLASIFDFTIAATMSLGPSGSSINAMTTAVPRLAAGITRSLFREDVAYHWDDFLAYDVPVFVPTGDDSDL